MNEEKQVVETLIRLAYFVVGVMVCALLSWLLPKWGIEEKGDDVTVDTMWVCKTIERPVVRDSVVVRYVTRKASVARDSASAHDTNVGSKDTVSVELPIVQKEYGDSTYKAWVSGYEVALDSIRITSPTVVVTKKVPKRWGIGVQAGYGLHGAYVGVGITYNILSF